MTSTILRKRSEKVVGADLPSQRAGRRVVFSKAPFHVYSQKAEDILGVSEEKVAAVGAAITFQPLPKHQVPAILLRDLWHYKRVKKGTKTFR